MVSTHFHVVLEGDNVISVCSVAGSQGFGNISSGAAGAGVLIIVMAKGKNSYPEEILVQSSTSL